MFIRLKRLKLKISWGFGKNQKEGDLKWLMQKKGTKVFVNVGV